jgi:cystathionine beta-lyase/cystathionine gamma-synthase
MEGATAGFLKAAGMAAIYSTTRLLLQSGDPYRFVKSGNFRPYFGTFVVYQVEYRNHYADINNPDQPIEVV